MRLKQDKVAFQSCNLRISWTGEEGKTPFASVSDQTRRKTVSASVRNHSHIQNHQQDNSRIS
eukprot:6291036-Amphidinium_carterae.1